MPPERAGPIVAVINRRSGTSLALPGDQPAALLKAAFAARGLDLTVHVDASDMLEERLAAVAAQRPAYLIVGGGDGTLRTAATTAMVHDLILGLLPLGTMNRFAADLGMPTTVADAAAVLADAVENRQIADLDVAVVNGHVYLCNSFIGLPPRYSQGRSRLRGEPLLARVRGYVTLARIILRRRHRLALQIDDGETVEVVRALSVAVSNNLYDKSGRLLFRRPLLDGGVLGLYISRHRSVLGLARKLMATALGRWRTDQAFTYRAVKKVTITGREDGFIVSNDGEVDRIDGPLEYEIRPRALRFLMPTA